MKPRVHALIKNRLVFSARPGFWTFHWNPAQRTPIISIVTTYSTVCQAQVERVEEEGLESLDYPRGAKEILQRFGCSESDIRKIFSRRPSLPKFNLTLLESKLNILQKLGLTPSHLVKVVACRPRILCCRLDHCLNERVEFFISLFGSREMLCKAIVRNPSLLTYDFHNKVKPIVALYEEMGVAKKDLTLSLLNRPTLIPRTSFNDEKLEYIRKSRVPTTSKMYKYVVTLIGISRPETIREKVANFEKFGFSDDEIWDLIGRAPLLLTLSVDKIQRNMTFVVGTMRLPANVVLKFPFLLENSLETVLKPRVCLAGKIRDMALYPQIEGPTLLKALRMTEERFLKAFVICHVKDVAEELMEFYRNAKCVKRLAEGAKKRSRAGFPF